MGRPSNPISLQKKGYERRGGGGSGGSEPSNLISGGGGAGPALGALKKFQKSKE